jgi:hypothetical protein
LENIGATHRPVTEVETELARMERDILKKVAAYFVKKALHGTRLRV